ncbi:prohead protease [Saccharomonospora sp. CUA-673]|uniref:Sec-independent protein translocase subunit TatA n=1 Tax=Saccharomonospora sp. CUA-673 TaxID=1904969 RepID=UPI000961A8C9|nr:Sec-independent protein translocase subunit TatA [Saccharomonospora sp. CUA-673]OLT46699.1 prohead protease [Saccharomonospora sp. CUA-673]
MNAFQPWHLLILLLVVIVLFGAKRLPDTARSIGKSMKIFKAETKDMRGEQADDDGDTATSADSKQISGTSAKAADDSGASAATSATSGSAASSTDDQVEQLQRQLDELKKQQGAEQAQKNG